MAGDRLTGSEKRALILWVVAGILGMVFAHRYFFRAFPEASVNFQVSREEALSRAQKFVGSLGEDVSGYQSAIVFDVDDNAKTYLEREMGLQQANQLMSSELHIWYWKVRFFRPQQEEEFRVRVSPSGEIVGYDHDIEEKRAGPELDRDAARARAETFSAEIGNGFGKLGFSHRRDQLAQTAQPDGLVIHVGEARIQGQGRALPAEGGRRGRPRERKPRVPESAGGLGARLQEIAVQQ